MKSNISMEHYENLCDLFNEKIKQLLNKEVKYILIPFNEMPEMTIYISEIIVPKANVYRPAELKNSNYAKIRVDLLKARYGINFECEIDQMTNCFKLRVLEEMNK